MALETLPVGPELFKTILIDVFDAGFRQSRPGAITVRMGTHTLAAHLVTLRPSFIQSNSPRPFASVLHIM